MFGAGEQPVNKGQSMSDYHERLSATQSNQLAA